MSTISLWSRDQIQTCRLLQDSTDTVQVKIFIFLLLHGFIIVYITVYITVNFRICIL